MATRRRSASRGPALSTALAGVLGFPVAHSRSPQMMGAAFRALGLDWRYVKLPVPPALFAETVRALEGSGFRGANVTIPHKHAALELADDRTPAAAAIGAANTLTFDGGTIEADNTDAPGFIAALGEDVRGVRALVLGAGGAGRAVAWALREAGAAEVMVWNRTPERARRLADDLGIEACDLRPATCDLLVNATSVGLDPRLTEDEMLAALGLTDLSPPQTVADLVYGERPTALIEWAARAGSRTVDGLEVLVRQGALSFERWTGREAPIDVMRDAARPEASKSA